MFIFQDLTPSSDPVPSTSKKLQATVVRKNINTLRVVSESDESTSSSNETSEEDNYMISSDSLYHISDESSSDSDSDFSIVRSHKKKKVSNNSTSLCKAKPDTSKDLGRNTVVATNIQEYSSHPGTSAESRVETGPSTSKATSSTSSRSSKRLKKQAQNLPFVVSVKAGTSKDYHENVSLKQASYTIKTNSSSVKRVTKLPNKNTKTKLLPAISRPALLRTNSTPALLHANSVVTSKAKAEPSTSKPSTFSTSEETATSSYQTKGFWQNLLQKTPENEVIKKLDKMFSKKVNLADNEGYSVLQFCGI
jgi:hypothetical protein